MSGLWQIYIDNFDLLEIWSLADIELVLRRGQQVPSEFQLALRAEYDRRNIARSTEKTVVRALRAPALGYEFIGDEGVLTVPSRSVRRLVQLTIWMLSKRRVSRKMLQILLGRWTRQFLLRRAGFCLLQQSWQLVTKWPQKPKRWAPSLRAELLMCLSWLPLLQSDLRVAVDPLVTASDASLDGGAVCVGRRLTSAGRSAATSLLRQPSSVVAEGLLVISLFDGIGGARRALDVLGVRPALTVAVEKNDKASRLVQ